MSSFFGHTNCHCHLTKERIENVPVTDTREQEESSLVVDTTGGGTVKLGITTLTESTNSYIQSISWGGTKWDWTQSSPANNKLTYYFGGQMNVDDSNYPAGVSYLNGSPVQLEDWTSVEKDAMRVGINLWTSMIGMPTEEVFNVSDANLKLYITAENVGYLGAQFGPHSGSYQGTGIYVRIPGNYWTDSLAPGGFGFITIIHELGHAMGCAHPHDTGGGSTVFPGVTSSSDKGDNQLNQNTYTVMSYIDTNSGINPNTPQSYGFCKGPMAFDVATMNYLYGLSSSYEVGNNTYEITGGTEKGIDGYKCIYDVGGEDLVIYNGTQAITIDLRPATIQNETGGGGFISKIDDSSIYSGLTIAQGVTIENVTSGSENDTIYQVDNVANIIDGRNGEDSVHYSGNYTDYSVVDISTNGDGTIINVSKVIDTITYTDSLYNIEKLVFADGTVFTNNLVSPPSVSVYSISPNLTINASNTTITSDLTITTNNQAIEKIEVIIDELTHTWVGDLFISLTNTGTGTSVVLCRLPGSGIYGSSGDDFINTVFTDSSLTDIDSISSSDSPYSGNYHSSNDGIKTYLSDFNGETANSTWRLTVTDTYPSLDHGTLVKWSLRILPGDPPAEDPASEDSESEDTDTEETQELPFEHGTLEVDHNWKTINLTKSFVNPVVIISDPTFRGGQPVYVRTTNITNNSFQVRLQEPFVQDIIHVVELLSYIVGEEGTHTLDASTGKIIQFGKVNTNKMVPFKPGSYETVAISGFTTTPVILTSSMTFNGGDPIVTRVHNVNQSSFSVAMQEEERRNIQTGHVTETIGWLAVTPGIHTASDATMESIIETNLTHVTKNVTFSTSFTSSPKVLAKISSTRGTDPCNIRITNINSSGFSLFIQEDKSHDNEINHISENFNYIAIGN
jgi:serralysin